MTSPATPKFATVDDVMSRYEGSFPSDRIDWLTTRLIDVEAELMGQIPSLRKTIDQIMVDNASIPDLGRLDRVKTLVCNKVLDLFRNPEGVSQVSRAMPDLTVSRTFTAGQMAGQVAFTEYELDNIRLHTNRAQFGSVTLDSWSTRDRGYCY